MYGAGMRDYYSTLNVSSTKKDFIERSFIFLYTPQGHEYWNNIANKNK